MSQTAFKLELDMAHLNQRGISHDVIHEPFENDGKAIYIWSGSIEGTIPNPLICTGDLDYLAECQDYPILTLGIPVISKKMLAVLLGVAEFDYATQNIVILDDKNKGEFDRKLKEIPSNIKVSREYYLFKLLDTVSAFDYSMSEYTVRRSNPSLPNVVSKLVLKEPEDGFPPIFKLSEVTGLFISQTAERALKKANVSGLCLTEVEVN